MVNSEKAQQGSHSVSTYLFHPQGIRNTECKLTTNACCSLPPQRTLLKSGNRCASHQRRKLSLQKWMQLTARSIMQKPKKVCVMGGGEKCVPIFNNSALESPASLLVIILDTNPHAWYLLNDDLPLNSAIANICVFINAHLAFNDANKVAVIASHSKRAVYLYPTPPTAATQRRDSAPQNDSTSDVEMVDSANGTITNPSSADANKYRPFYQVQQAITSSLQKLMDDTKPEALSATTAIAGALTLALTYINKQTIIANSVIPSSDANAPGAHAENAPVLLTSRILILSVSGDLANQYIPIMNTIFACQRMSIPIDIAKIAGDSVFLQQASDATKGIFIQIEHPQGLLQYLMMGFLSDSTSRQHLISATQAGVDFRAACFCHRKVIDMGYVCSVCLSSKSDSRYRI